MAGQNRQNSNQAGITLFGRIQSQWYSRQLS